MTELRLRHDGVAWKDVDEEVVALDEHAAVYLATNPAGAVLWRSLALGATRAELADELVREFGIDASAPRRISTPAWPISGRAGCSWADAAAARHPDAAGGLVDRPGAAARPRGPARRRPAQRAAARACRRAPSRYQEFRGIVEAHEPEAVGARCVHNCPFGE